MAQNSYSTHLRQLIHNNVARLERSFLAGARPARTLGSGCIARRRRRAVVAFAWSRRCTARLARRERRTAPLAWRWRRLARLAWGRRRRVRLWLGVLWWWRQRRRGRFAVVACLFVHPALELLVVIERRFLAKVRLLCLAFFFTGASTQQAPKP